MTTDTYLSWARRHPQAAAELAALLTPAVAAVSGEAASEARVQSLVRLEAAQKDCRLWRNNKGAGKIEGGQFTRFGLANDTEALGKKLRSSDLVGWRRRLITPGMVGTVIAQFVSREVKYSGWKFRPNDEHEQGQAAWLALVAADGGDSAFATGVGTL